MLLIVKNLHAYYGNVHVLKRITFHINKGEIVTIIGGNGAGKSTLLKTISGLIPTERGEILFEKQKINSLTAERILRRGISHVPEGRKIFAKLSVRDNLELGAFTQKDRNEIAYDFEKVYTLFPILGERRKQSAGTLSGGEQQMLAIARSLMSRPKLIMLDEPSMGLAPKVVLEVFKTIKELKEMETTILLIEQNARAALALADRGYVMEMGMFTSHGDKEVLLDNEEVKRAYLGKGYREVYE
ncbi:MAG: ABC transporter ATP-binding protein [Deltaproteobacteria bacterium]|nr:ABC transporter ATP-binding protein [Candidatus Zymogenaceae bacterium]